jgi:acyl-coenzyme A thioesterase PaaI-like protein
MLEWSNHYDKTFGGDVSAELAAELPVLTHGPEGLFGVQHLAVSGTSATGSMRADAWITGLGSLGVLVDDVLGYAILGARLSNSWSVSTEIAIDLMAPVPTRGVLRVEASLTHADARGGFAVGTVTSGDDTVLAVCRQRGRFVPAPAHLLSSDEDGTAGVPVTAARGLEGQFNPKAGAATGLAVTPLLGNPLGNLHGGVTLAASELIAAEALGRRLRSASIHVTYVRPVPVGTTLQLEAEVVFAGRTLGSARVIGRNADRKPCTVATVTLH